MIAAEPSVSNLIVLTRRVASLPTFLLLPLFPSLFALLSSTLYLLLEALLAHDRNAPTCWPLFACDAHASVIIIWYFATIHLVPLTAILATHRLLYALQRRAAASVRRHEREQHRAAAAQLARLVMLALAPRAEGVDMRRHGDALAEHHECVRQAHVEMLLGMTLLWLGPFVQDCMNAYYYSAADRVTEVANYQLFVWSQMGYGGFALFALGSLNALNSE